MERKEIDAVSEFFGGFEKAAAAAPFSRMRAGRLINRPVKPRQPGVIDKIRGSINSPANQAKFMVGAPLVAGGAGIYGVYKGIDSAIGDPGQAQPW